MSWDDPDKPITPKRLTTGITGEGKQNLRWKRHKMLQMRRIGNACSGSRLSTRSSQGRRTAFVNKWTKWMIRSLRGARAIELFR